MGLREIKAQARRDLHQAMQVPAAYYVAAGAAPELISVRVHSKATQQGDLKGTNLNYAEREEVEPKLVFDRAEVANPPRNGLVIISATEGYRIGQTEPPDGMTVKAAVSRLEAPEMVGKTLPDELI